MSPILSPPNPGVWGTSLGPRRSSSGSSSSGYLGNGQGSLGVQSSESSPSYLGGMATTTGGVVIAGGGVVTGGGGVVTTAGGVVMTGGGVVPGGGVVNAIGGVVTAVNGGQFPSLASVQAALPIPRQQPGLLGDYFNSNLTNFASTSTITTGSVDAFKSEGSLHGSYGTPPPAQDSCNVWLPLSDGVLETVCARATAISGAIWAADLPRLQSLLEPISSHLRTLVTSHRCVDNPDPPLLTCCRLGTVAMAQYLLEECGADVNEHHEAVTALHIAVYNGEEAMVQLLLQHGANPSVMCPDGTPLILLAASRGDFFNCELLVQKMFADNTLGIQTQINLLELAGTYLVDMGMQDDGHFRKGVEHFLTAMDMRYDENGTLKILKRGWSRNSGATFKAVAALAKESQTMEEMETATASRHEMRMESVLALKRILYNSVAAFIGLVKRAHFFTTAVPNYYECSFYLLRAGEQLRDAVDYSPNFDAMAPLCVPMFGLITECMQFMFNLEANWQAFQTMYHTQIIHRYSRSQLAVRLADLFLRASATYISRLRPPTGLNPRHLAPEWQTFCFDVFRIVEVIQMSEDEKCKLNKARHELLIRISSVQTRDLGKPPHGNSSSGSSSLASLPPIAAGSGSGSTRSRLRSESSQRSFPRKMSSSGRLLSSGSSDGGASSLEMAPGSVAWSPSSGVSSTGEMALLTQDGTAAAFAPEVPVLSQRYGSTHSFPGEVAVLPQRYIPAATFPGELPILPAGLPVHSPYAWTTVNDAMTSKATGGHGRGMMEPKSVSLWTPVETEAPPPPPPSATIWAWPTAQTDPADQSSSAVGFKTTNYGAANPIGVGKPFQKPLSVYDKVMDVAMSSQRAAAEASMASNRTTTPTSAAEQAKEQAEEESEIGSGPIIQEPPDSPTSESSCLDLESLPTSTSVSCPYPAKQVQIIRMREVEHVAYRMRSM